MMPWPELELNDHERKFVRKYRTNKYPGVLRRKYTVVLNDTANPAQDLPQVKLSGQVQISRRTRIFGLTFSGRIDSWRLQIITAAGNSYTQKTPRTQQDPVVSSMFPGTSGNALSLGTFTALAGASASNGSNGVGPNSALVPFIPTVNMPFPLIIDPNWVLTPNETLIFNGTPLPVAIVMPDEEVKYQPLVLSIGVHVWEFPGMTS